MLYSTTPGFGDSQQVLPNIMLSRFFCELVSLLRPCACGVPHIPQHQDLIGHEEAQVCHGLHFQINKSSNPTFILLLKSQEDSIAVSLCVDISVEFVNSEANPNNILMMRQAGLFSLKSN